MVSVCCLIPNRKDFNVVKAESILLSQNRAALLVVIIRREIRKLQTVGFIF